MNIDEEIIFSSDDFSKFYQWINLNVESVTWQGKNLEEFERFWSSFFIDGLSIRQLTQRFEFASFEAQVGPLNSWFKWLFDKLICYTFIYKDVSIFQISKETEISLSEISNILRTFFIDFFPFLDEYISNQFQMSNFADENIYLKYSDVSEKLSIDKIEIGSTENEIMTSMEVTLYPEWRSFNEKLSSELFNPRLDISKLKTNASLKKQFRFLRDVALLIFVGAVAILIIQKGNLIYEKYLVDKISVYEPQFKWLDKSLSFKSVESKSISEISLKVEDIENVEDQNAFPSEFEEEERFETESEVVLTSVDALPKDFDVANLEQSEFEEQRRRGYRDSRYGNTKVYRVMMKSTDTLQSKEKLNKLMNIYKVSQVDNVRPGTHVPGGLYYNIFVPRIHIKEFLAQIMDIDQAVLYESRTITRRNPPGKNKVFIWIKSLN